MRFNTNLSSVCLFVVFLYLADCKNNTVADEQKQFAWLVMETLTVLLQGSNTTNTNAGKHNVC